VKILHIIQRYPPAVGGSELWCREICQYLAATGDEVKVLTLNIVEEEEFWRDPPIEKCTLRLGRVDWDGQVLVRRYQRSLPVYTLHHLWFKHCLDRLLKIYFYGPHSVEMYGRMFAEVKASDVVHLHTIPYPHNFIGYLVARLFRKRIVITPYFHPGHPHYERWCHYWLLKRCDGVLVLSEYEREHLAANGVDRAKIIVTGCGIHEEEYVPTDLSRCRQELFERYGFSEGTKIVLFVGRKAEYKGVAVLIEAVRRLLPRYDLALLLMGPSLSWFDEFYRHMPPEEKRRIIDLGTLSHQDKVNLLHLSDVLVLPSQFESFGIVFLEAWACGTPVIGSETGPMPDIIGQGGLTFELGNPENLALSIETLLKDPQMAHKMASHGREKLRERYNWSAIGQTVRQTYRPNWHASKRILICSNLFPPHSLGGAELVAYHQAKILKEMGHEVQIFAGRLGGDVIHPYKTTVVRREFQQTCVNLSPRDLSGDSWNFHHQRITAEFTKVLERFRPDVVHFHNLAGLSVKQIDVCHQRAIPTVLTLHDYWGFCFKNTMIKNDGSLCLKGGFDCLGCRETLSDEPPLPSPVRNAHIQLSLQKVDRLIAPSHYLAQRYVEHGIPREKLTVIPNGVDLEHFAAQRTPHDILMLGFIGYLGAHKGVEFLLRSLPLMCDIDKVRLLIVGDGEKADYLRALCHDLRLDRYVTFYGWVQNQRIPAIYEQLDVLVVPSIWPENSPVTITEAMASGIPVIASDIGGIGELVEEGITGFLVPPHDSAALADRIMRFLARPELRCEMGEKALAKIRRYGIREQVGHLLKIYEALLEQGSLESALDLDIVLYDSRQRWDLHVREAFHQLAEMERRIERRLLICHVDLADEETLRAAKLLLIPSAGEDSFRHALEAFRRQMPIVVHTSAWELKELCLASNAGLFYAEPAELRECLEVLLSHDSLRQAMAVKGREFVALYGGWGLT
jgi:glycosyltransferase involved in cell wall biosynthesis